jgi:hypothetical protein
MKFCRATNGSFRNLGTVLLVYNHLFTKTIAYHSQRFAFLNTALLLAFMAQTEQKVSKIVSDTAQTASKTGLFLFVLSGLIIMAGTVWVGFYAEDTIMPWWLGKPTGRVNLPTPHAAILEPKPKPSAKVPAYLPPAPDEPNMTNRSGLVLWLRGDAVPTEYKDGELIVAMPDASAARNDAKQATPIARPRLIAKAINDKPALRFNGVETFLYFEDGLARGTKDGFTPATVFAVWSRPQYCDNRQAPDGQGFQRLFSSGGLGVDYQYNGAYAVVHDPGAPPNFPNSVELEPRKYFAPLTPPKLLKAVFDKPVDLRRFFIGRINASPEQFFTGDLAEILVFSRILSATEQQQIESYLKTKYALK